MAIILATITDTCRAKWPRVHAGQTAFSPISYFQLGEGGWIDPGAGKQRRDPDPTFTALDATLDLARPLPSKRYPTNSLFVFQKSFIGADLVFVSPSTMRCRCFLDFGEANDDGFGNPPEFWELGVFDAANVLLGYGTFPLQLKDGTKQLENFMELVW
jgi:hypothetical protein